MRRPIVLAILMLAVAFGWGCAKTEAPAGDSQAQVRGGQALPEAVRTAVAVAHGLEATPDDIEGVLSAQGLTVEKYEDLMYEISSDPVLREAYNSAISHEGP